MSGGKPLTERAGLGAAVAAIEAGDAEVVAAGYFDRLFRSLTLQAEVVHRVERASGKVLAVDVGEVTNASAGQWLSGTMMGAVSEYYRRSVKERSAEGQARAVARGAVLWRHVPIGYRRREGATLEPDPERVPIVRRAFEMRAAGASHAEIRWDFFDSGRPQPTPNGDSAASRFVSSPCDFSEYTPPAMQAQLTQGNITVKNDDF